MRPDRGRGVKCQLDLESSARLCECEEKESWDHSGNATGDIIAQSVGGQNVECKGQSTKLVRLGEEECRVRRGSKAYQIGRIGGEESVHGGLSLDGGIEIRFGDIFGDQVAGKSGEAKRDNSSRI